MAKKQTTRRTSFPLAATEGFGDDKGKKGNTLSTTPGFGGEGNRSNNGNFDYSPVRTNESGVKIYSLPQNPNMPKPGTEAYTTPNAKSGLTWEQTSKMNKYASEFSMVKNPKTGKKVPVRLHDATQVQDYAKGLGVNLAYESAQTMVTESPKKAYEYQKSIRQKNKEKVTNGTSKVKKKSKASKTNTRLKSYK